ncbi:MAG: hypothetical protein AAFY17_01125 [Cyanobacteria bacterium J06642_11]
MEQLSHTWSNIAADGVTASLLASAGTGIGAIPIVFTSQQLGYSIPLALVLATVSGWLEPLGGLIGVALATVGTTIAPMSMALAAGAIVFVVLHELLPELNLKQFNAQGSAGVVTGAAMMGMMQQWLS